MTGSMQLALEPASLKTFALIPSGMFYTTRRGRKVLGVVLHVTAGLQDLGMSGVDDSAEGTNRWGAGKNRADASWHVCVDSDSIDYALPSAYTAWHVVGYNGPTIGLEIANRDARWDNKPAAWVEATLRNAARAAAGYVKTYGLPLQLASKAQVDRALATNTPFGFTYHMWLDPVNRRDPGTTFPWNTFIGYVRQALTGEDDLMSDEQYANIMRRLDRLPEEVWSKPRLTNIFDSAVLARGDYSPGHMLRTRAVTGESAGVQLDVNAIVEGLADKVADAVIAKVNAGVVLTREDVRAQVADVLLNGAAPTPEAGQ